MSHDVTDPIVAEAARALASKEIDSKDLSLEALILLINTERLKHLQDKTEKEFATLKERQEKVAELHNILKAINAKTTDKGELDVSKDDELKGLLDKLKDFEVDAPEDKETFNSDERDRLVENIRMTIEDLNVQNDMQMQTISRLTNERYESYQMARSILKPLHDAKTAHARGIRGA